jgi:ribosomal protein S18 acetylase RimI-like enzyme
VRSTVRRATAQDIPAWLALAGEVEPLFGPMPDIEHAIARGVQRGTALVTGPGGAITGGMLLSRDDRPHRIQWLAVASAARGHGLGRALVRAAFARWPEGDVDVITFTDDTPGAEAARRLYARCGMELTGPAGPGPDGALRDRYLLRR